MKHVFQNITPTRTATNGNRPDLRALCGPRHTSDTLKKAKRIEKSGKTKPELGL